MVVRVLGITKLHLDGYLFLSFFVVFSSFRLLIFKCSNVLFGVQLCVYVFFSSLFYLQHRKSFIFVGLFFSFFLSNFFLMKRNKPSHSIRWCRSIHRIDCVLLVECIFILCERMKTEKKKQRQQHKKNKNAIKESGLVYIYSFMRFFCVDFFYSWTFSLDLHFRDLKFVHQQGYQKKQQQQHTCIHKLCTKLLLSILLL